MFTIAHISDIHLGPLPRLTLAELASKRITGFVNWHRNRRKHLFENALDLLVSDLMSKAPDHVVITGDLVNLATSIEIERAALWLQALGTPDRVTFVPGNHDAYVPGARDRAVVAWYPYIRGDDDPEDCHAGMRLFPTLRRRGPLALIGCSTANATPPFMASGVFGARQAKAAAELLRATGAEDRFRVLMIHHPPFPGAVSRHKRMIGMTRFAGMLAECGAELVLHGHSHLNSLHRLGSRAVPVLGVASAAQGPGGRKPRSSYNLLTLSREPSGRWRLDCERRGLDGEAKAFETIEQMHFSLPPANSDGFAG